MSLPPNLIDACCQRSYLEVHWACLPPSSLAIFHSIAGCRRPPPLMQAPCDPPTDIVVVVTGYRPTQGGWIRLALLGVAGSGDVTAVEIKGSPQVRKEI